MTHYIKLLEDFEEAVFNGDKTFEVRFNDRGYQKGDTIVFEVIHRDSGLPKVRNLLDGIKFEITYVLNGFGLEEGNVALAIKRVPTYGTRMEGESND